MNKSIRKCILDTRCYDGPKKSICGKNIMGFYFEDICHWFYHVKGDGRLLGCQKCIKQIQEIVIINQNSQEVDHEGI